MDKLQAMQVFTRVVETSSFTRAADSMDLPKGSVTRLIKELEAYLDTRLLNRTTRSLSVTSAGAAYYEQCARILAEIDEAEASFTDAPRAPKGKLRVDMASSIGRLIVVPALDEFRAKYPEIELTLGFGDRLVDLVQEGIDCTLRIGNLDDSTLVARRVGVFRLLTAASPGYIREFGAPKSPHVLERHRAVNYFSSRTGRMINMNFQMAGEAMNVKVPSTLAANDGDAHLQCGLKGFGLIQIPRILAQPHLDSGELVEVLSEWNPASLPISAVFPQSRHLSPQVRAFVNWVAEIFERCTLLRNSAPGFDTNSPVKQGNVNSGRGS
ncbi:LysR family transcriptional regulator [Cupriavidus sp. D39]|uniref:LysR family transcriptional regulator n=1 Tax=Cupriavidus sp. D39 TaxID=2997877 RepID=UPI00226DDAC0|nr:LysR family transcriptional regulator [Cupriavidus sp. D39]MCY0852477.1 LysR family transcriptional regulator [Cupriavidus sp. D39]